MDQKLLQSSPNPTYQYFYIFGWELSMLSKIAFNNTEEKENEDITDI